MPDEYLIGIGIVGKQPPVPIGSAAVNLSGPNTHAELAPYFTRTLVKACGRWRRNVAARNGGPSCVSPARQLKREVCGIRLYGFAVWAAMNEQPGPPAFGYPAKDQAKAGGRVCRVMSMLVLDKLHYGKLVPEHM